MSEVNLNLLGDRVLIEPFEAKEQTSSGLYIPNQAQERPNRGKIVAVGPGNPGECMTVYEGAEVLYGKFSGTEIELNGRKLLLMKEFDIYAIINRD